MVEAHGAKVITTRHSQFKNCTFCSSLQTSEWLLGVVGNLEAQHDGLFPRLMQKQFRNHSPYIPIPPTQMRAAPTLQYCRRPLFQPKASYVVPMSNNHPCSYLWKRRPPPENTIRCEPALLVTGRGQPRGRKEKVHRKPNKARACACQ